MTLTCLLLMTFLAPQATGLRGDVTDPGGLPVPGAVVAVKGTVQLAVTDEQGRFSLPQAGAGSVLVVSMSGFATRTVNVTTTSSPVHITLALNVMSDEVTVRAPAAAAPPDARLPLRPIDVVRTAGAQADMMRALAALPGVVRVDDGAGLFVRGGDVSETRVLLDGAVINHPYRYETPTGGFRGAVDPFLTQGVSFATGGFSADYGNSLSAIVDMHGLARPGASRMTWTAGLAGVAGSVAQPIGAHGGVRFAANKSTPKLLFAVNPSPREFDQLPGGWDLSGSVYLDSASRGNFRMFISEQHDHVGVELEKDAFVGFLHSGSRHRLLTSQWDRALNARWNVTASFGIDRYVGTLDVGVFAIEQADNERSARVDLGGLTGGWTLRFGAEAGGTSTSAIGRVPVRGGDFGGVGGSTVFDVAHADWRAGGYGEVTRTIGAATATLGMRADYFAQSSSTRLDPRANVSIALNGSSRLRLAWGLYHQAASPKYFDNERGATTLRPMTATHYILGYEWGKIDGPLFFRAEAYAKTYRDLPLQDDAIGFSNDGYGHARGLDLYLRRVWHFIDVRASASWSDTARRWTSPDQQDRYPLPAGTWRPDFSIPFSWQLVVNAPISRTIAIGTAWNRASGRPFTPAIGALDTPDGFQPIWGEINSGRLPHYGRVDLSVSMTRTIGKKGFAVFFASVDNVGGRRNFFEYAYSADYTSRHPVLSTSPRSFYIGTSITR